MRGSAQGVTSTLDPGKGARMGLMKRTKLLMVQMTRTVTTAECCPWMWIALGFGCVSCEVHLSDILE